jgi:1,4-alpha-glucan branching enzyme
MAKANKDKAMKTPTITQQFSFTAPAALSVQLVGDFTRWQEKPIQLQKGEKGVWQASVELEPGTHHYRFMVDGQWQDDPECKLQVGNPFGTKNMVREVHQPKARA